jgi:hypothetical protein
VAFSIFFILGLFGIWASFARGRSGSFPKKHEIPGNGMDGLN